MINKQLFRSSNLLFVIFFESDRGQQPKQDLIKQFIIQSYTCLFFGQIKLINSRYSSLFVLLLNVNCKVMSNQIVELKKGMYQIIEQIGRGASSCVFKISKFLDTSEIIGLNTNQSIYSKPCLEGKACAKLQTNPDLIKIDSLISAQQEGIQESDHLTHKGTSFLVNHACENRKPSFSYREDIRPQAEEEEQFYALKIIILTPETPESVIKERDFQAQLRILKELDHPGIIKVIDDAVFLKNDKKELHEVMEWCSGGTLLKFIDSIYETNFNSSEKDQIFKYYFSQITDILCYLEMKGISHRDIKAQNFVLDDKYHLKLIDFGSCERIKKLQQDNSLITSQKGDRNYIGTKHYISPQMIDRYRKSFPRQYYSKVDIWSAGVLFYKMIVRQYPFEGRNTYTILDSIKVKDPDLNKLLSEPLRELLSIMLKKNPDQRHSMNELAKLTYFEGVNFKQIFQMESPYVRLMREQATQELFRGHLTVRMDNQVKQRIISLIKKKQRCHKNTKETQTLQKICSFSFLDIKKNCSDITDYPIEKKIDSQSSLDQVLVVKKYLGIGKIGSKAYPKLFQLQSSSRLTVSKLICTISWADPEERRILNQPDQVQLRFGDSQKLQLFIKAFQLLQEESNQYDAQIKPKI